MAPLHRIRRLARLAIWLLLAPIATAWAAGDEPLPPDEAFALSARAPNPDALSVRFRISEGYYLYHDKLSVESLTPGVVLGEPRIPAGKVKQDEFFGEVETHRKKLAITVPVLERPAAATEMAIQVGNQGCADIGICYPPQLRTVALSLPAQAERPAAAAKPAGLDFSQLGLSQDDIPDPAEAFRVEVLGMDSEGVDLRWTIHPNTYLYRSKFGFALDGTNATLGEAQMRAGERKTDEFFGEVEIYHGGQLDQRLPLTGDAAGARLLIDYQGCADAGICYPPQQTALSLPGSPASGTAAPSEAAAASAGADPVAPAPAQLSEQDQLTRQLQSQNLALVLLAFFGLGLLLALTPCVFPMIPILSSIIVGQGEALSTRKAFSLSLTYVLAMALTYTVVGVLVGLSGENIQAWFQTPWVLWLFAAMFVALSLSMFGFYELQMPSAIQTRLNNLSNQQSGGSYIGVAIMGLLSALIVGPCVTAPLMAVLVYIAESGDALKGGLVLFSLSMGMGAPLLLIGTSAGKLMPRAGGWMESVKAVFGVLMLGMAIWMLERILPAPVILALAALLLIVSAVYLGALQAVPEGRSGWSQLWRGLGVALLVWGVVLLIGAASGGRSLLTPLAGLSVGSGGNAQSTESHALPFEPVDSIAALDARVAAASAAGRPVMLDFYADWCVSCKEMEAFTFPAPAVQQALADFVVLQADVTANNDDHKALLKRYGLFGPPAILFFNRDGEEQRARRVVGFVDSEAFAATVRAVD